MIFTSSKEHWKLSKNDGFCECCIMTFLKTTIRDEDNQFYKKISWLPGCGYCWVWQVCIKEGKDGEKGEKIGEKRLLTPSLFSSFFLSPLPRPLYISHSGFCGYCGQDIHLDFPKLQYVWYPEKLFQHMTSQTYFAQILKFSYPDRKLHVC